MATMYALTQCDNLWNRKSTICGVTDCKKLAHFIELEWDGNTNNRYAIADIYLPDQNKIYENVNIQNCPTETIARCQYDQRDIINTIVITNDKRSMFLILVVFIILITGLLLNCYKKYMDNMA